MFSAKTITRIAAVLSAVFAISLPGGAMAQGPDRGPTAGATPPIGQSATQEDAVMEAVMGFYGALEVIFSGETGAMVDIWSHADDVTYMGPDGGYLVGWDQVLKNWEEQASLKMGDKGASVTPKDVRIVVGQDIAVVHNLEIGHATIDDKDATVSLRATNLFRLENGVWKQIGHHADLLPPLVKAIGDGN